MYTTTAKLPTGRTGDFFNGNDDYRVIFMYLFFNITFAIVAVAVAVTIKPCPCTLGGFGNLEISAVQISSIALEMSKNKKKKHVVKEQKT